MSSKPNPQEILSVIADVSDDEMRAWLPLVMSDHDGKHIDPMWPLRGTKTAPSYVMDDNDITEFGQRVSESVCKTFKVKPFTFADEVSVKKLSTLMSLNSGIFYALLKTAGWTK